MDKIRKHRCKVNIFINNVLLHCTILVFCSFMQLTNVSIFSIFEYIEADTQTFCATKHTEN